MGVQIDNIHGISWHINAIWWSYKTPFDKDVAFIIEV